ncbi:hypothetical protein KQV33_23300, partial [Vibrio vulnificus]|nr:hypothetical protein [Vibrio vulnificus]
YTTCQQNKSLTKLSKEFVTQELKLSIVSPNLVTKNVHYSWALQLSHFTKKKICWVLLEEWVYFPGLKSSQPFHEAFHLSKQITKTSIMIVGEDILFHCT